VGPSQLIWQADTTERVVSLTFDAGSDRGFGEEILDYLADQGICLSKVAPGAIFLLHVGATTPRTGVPADDY
jgi:hypothetical protein